MNKQTITKIVITGGPCAGKSAALHHLRSAFEKKGYTVLLLPETATELIQGGIAPWSCGSTDDYQRCLLRLQLAKEAVFEQAARTMASKRILLVCDRGAIDCKAYMNDAEFSEALAGMAMEETQMLNAYDAVFHLVTAAKGATAFYTTANNNARTESPEEAAKLDDRLLAAWTGHPHLRVIDNTGSFETKIKRLLEEVTAFLGDTAPCESE